MAKSSRIVSFFLFIAFFFTTLTFAAHSPVPAPTTNLKAGGATPSPSQSPTAGGGNISSPAPSPAPNSPASAPYASPPAPPSDLTKDAPSPAPEGSSPAKSPSPVAGDSPVPVPGVEDDVGKLNVDEDKKGGDGGMNGRSKAGIVVGVMAAAVVVGLGGFVYKKRRENIRRAQYSSAARREFLGDL